MEALEESIDLQLNRFGHLVLAHQLNILPLVEVSDGNGGTARLQLHSTNSAKLVALCSESEMAQHTLYGVVEHPPQIAVVVRIQSFHVLVVHLPSEHVLVERSREVGLQVVAVEQRLPDDAPDELEEVQVVRIHVGGLAWMEGAGLSSRLCEQAVVRIEDLPREDLEPLSGQTTGIHSLLANEGHAELSPHLLAAAHAQLVVRIHEDLTAPHMQPDDVVAQVTAELPQTLPQVVALVVEV
mmetsp:Transcript_53247/g.127021  ORF Transcript_53247/g.127021 Transcript_53247/m.127021 type:complete len:240 (-) Transcript_53247:2859-3578(-)